MMLTQTNSANRHDNRHDASDTTMPHGSQPGSPTLTNPDMILPDYNDLLGYNDLPQPQRPAWNRGHSIQDGFQFHDNGFYVNPDPLSTPIIYGNGTMLSDIGEVTEVESNAGTMASRNASRRTVAQSFDDDSRLPKSLGRNIPRYNRRDRRFSNESTSTIGTLERTAFADFDDTISMGGDSIFQGDDEESLASSYAEEIAVPRPLHNAKKVSIRKPSDEGSANFISKRAEEILANAKQRLTDMEDNLSRARTLSYSTVTTSSMNTSSVGRSASISYRTTPASSIVSSSSHGRNMSENGMAKSGTEGSSLQRSASALGSAGGYRRVLPTSRSVDVLRSPTDQGAYTVTYQAHDLPLEPLGEDDYPDTISGRMGGSGTSAYGTYFDTGSARSAIDVRDLQDQMNGLKGKISSLREQARVDSLKRRSLQSLRTPSPFTSASWEPTVTESRSLQASENDPSPLETTNDDTQGDADRRIPEVKEEDGEIQRPREGFEEAHAKQVSASHSQASQQQSFQPSSIHHSLPDHGNSKLDDEEKKNTRNGDSLRHSDAVAESKNDKATDAAAPQGYESESGESLYHDSFQHQISHEDRADAFDYEHFFLHSAMGSVRSRSGSVDSNDSVETTRGPTALRRRSSMDTIASVESFQTATEELNDNSSNSNETNNSHSSSAQGYRVYTPADLFEVGRPASDVSFHDSSSGSDSAAAYTRNLRRHGSVSYRPSSIISMSTKPSCSSFESTGTTRSFPLVSKTKRNSGILTPGSSPDQGVKHSTKTMLKESPSIREADLGSRGPSPAIQMLSPADQSAVEALVAGLGQCVLVLGEPGGAATGAHEVYRRRIEAARKILEGRMEVP